MLKSLSILPFFLYTFLNLIHFSNFLLFIYGDVLFVLMFSRSIKIFSNSSRALDSILYIHMVDMKQLKTINFDEK